jgi:hypothetical protein
MTEYETELGQHWKSDPDAAVHGLNQLDAIVREAEQEEAAAHRVVERNEFVADPIPELEALREYQHGVECRIPGCEEDPQRERVLVVALCRRIARDPDLTLRFVSSMLQVRDKSVTRNYEQARQARIDAARARDEFLAGHREQIEAAAEAKRRRAISEALERGDLKEAMRLEGLGPARALTTADLSGGTAADGRRPSGNRILNVGR